MNKEWNLDILYLGFDDPKYSEDTELLTKEIEALGALSNDISNIEEKKLVSAKHTNRLRYTRISYR